MPKINRLPEPRIVQSFIEWRYPKAHRYWDVTGSVMQQVESAFPGWTCTTSEGGFKFEGTTEGASAATFYWDKATIFQVGKGKGQFSEAAARFWEILSDAYHIRTATRVGHRTLLLYQMGSTKDGAHWLRRFDLWSFLDAEGAKLGRPETIGVVLRTHLDDGNRSVRLEVNAGTVDLREAEERTVLHGVVVDLDIAVEEVDAGALDLRKFMAANQDYIRNNVAEYFRSRK